MSFLRFGGLPEGGRSAVLWGAVGLEDGLSVFEARATRGGYAIRLGHLFQASDLARVLKEGRPLYRIEGTVIGRGLSNEPLLADARVVEVVGSEAEITVEGTGICSVYLCALMARWSEQRRAGLGGQSADELERWGVLEDWDEMTGRTRPARDERRETA